MRILSLHSMFAMTAGLALLTACEQEPLPEQAQRISLEASRQRSVRPLPSPDTANAIWRVATNGQAISFGVTADGPMLTLACELGDQPPQFQIIRHVPARPGQKALFPVIGNGRISRLPLDAELSGGEWRWEGSLPAADEQMDVFTGPGKIEATLPGRGTLMIAGSAVPGEFVDWCRADGKFPAELTDESATTDEEANAPEASGEAGSEASGPPPVR